MNRENFFILLELPLSPLPSAADVRAALHRKKQEWTRDQDNPARRNQALFYLGMTPEIEHVMLSPELAAAEATRGEERQAEMLRQFEAELRILEGKGHILLREAAAIALKYKLYGVTREDVERSATVPVADAPPDNRPSDNRPVDTGEIIDRPTARTIRRNLALLGHADLYAFLGEPPYSSIRKLQDAAEEKRRSATAGAKSSEATVTQELAALCARMFTDFDSKQRYDRYLKVGAYPVLGDMIDEEETRAQYISTTALLRLANFGVETYSIKVIEAEDYIRRYCAAYDIPIDTQGKMTACPACGGKTERDGAVCRHCAAPLSGSCPGCGSAFEGGEGICAQCGFALCDMVKALAHITEAEAALIENNWGGARRNAQYAAKYWPSHPMLDALEKRATSLEQRYAKYAEAVADCISQRQYYAAQELIDEAATSRFKLPAHTIEHVASVISELERKLKTLTEAGGVSFQQAITLAESVADSMELSRLMGKHPPEPPRSLAAMVDGNEVRTAWGSSRSTGILDYVLVRKAGEPPMTAFDGEVLYEGPRNSFIDTTARPLCTYYYRVYVKRAGAYSEHGATSDAALIIPEIQGLRILPADGTAHLSWDFSADIRQVLIRRKLGGDKPSSAEEGIEIPNTRLDGFSDQRLKNDVEYWYQLTAVYIVDGRAVTSKGISESVVPRKDIAPIERIILAKADGGESEFVVNWMNPQHNDILLLSSPKKPALTLGQVVPIDVLLTEYRRLDLDARQPDSARFSCAFSGSMYVFVAAVYGKFATIGAGGYLTNVLDVENLTCDIISGTIYVNMKWPQSVSEIVVSHRFDRHPERADEIGATHIRYTREQYDFDAAAIIREPERAMYHVTVFASFTAPDGQRTYSKGVRITVNNRRRQDIFYKLSYSKNPLSRSAKLSVNLRSPDRFVQPKIAIVGKVGRLPLSKADGVSLHDIDREIKVGGEIGYEYQTSPLPENLYIRLFLHDETQYGAFRLVPDSKLKIT